MNWSDIDLSASTTYGRRNLVYIPHEGMILKQLKTQASVRRLILSPCAIEALQEWKIEQAEHRLKLGETWQECDAIFTQWNGKRMHVDTPTKRAS